MDIITTIIYIILFVIMMIFVFSIGMLKKFIPKKEVILIILVAFLIGSIGGAFFLEPIYREVPAVVNVIESNMPNTEETLYLDLSSSLDLNELAENLTNTPGFRSYDEKGITITLWSFNEREQAYFEDIIGNIDSHYEDYTVNSSGRIDITLAENYTASDALKSFSDWYKLVYGETLSYAQIQSVLVIDSSAHDTFADNLLDRGVVASKIEGPVQDTVNATNASMLSSTHFVIATGLFGVAVSLFGIYYDSIAVYGRRFKKFVNTKRKR